MDKAHGSSRNQHPDRGTAKLSDADALDVKGGATSAPTGASGTPILKPILKPVVPRAIDPCW